MKRSSARRLCIGIALIGALLASTSVVVAAAGTTPPRGVVYEHDAGARALATGPCVFGTPWTHNDLTYSVFAHTNDMSVSRQEAAIRKAFDIWQNETPLRFNEVASGGDIIVYFQPFGSFDDLGTGSMPPSGRVVLNDDYTWDDQPDPLPAFDVVSVLAHEIGHAIGMCHINDSEALMYPTYLKPHRYLSPADRAAIQAIYPCPSGCGGGGTTTTDTEATTTTTVGSVLPAFSIDDYAVTEPAHGRVTMHFAVHLVGTTGLKTSVAYATNDGTATSATDYRAVHKTLKFAPGQTTKYVNVSVRADGITATRTFTVVLSSPKNATIDDGTATGTIRAAV